MVPAELKRAFAGIVAARREGEAALERARGETAALRSLANAGRMIEDNPGLLQLRILQQLGGSSGNTIMLGVPGAEGRSDGRPQARSEGRSTGRAAGNAAPSPSPAAAAASAASSPPAKPAAGSAAPPTRSRSTTRRRAED